MSPVSAGMKNAVLFRQEREQQEAPERWVAEDDPGAESGLCRGAQDVGTEHHAPPAEPVAHDATDEQEDHEGNRLGRQHCADFGRRRMA